ncbi:MAG TPA: DUF2254 domain-containing protein [Clostridia bacterium]|nr:DUF2254 domain-containing protein [Clostridia bacterium]
MVNIENMYINFKKKIWFYPLIYGTFSFFMAVLILLGDSVYLSAFEKVFPKILYINIDLAVSILGIIAGAFITITTFTFSTTMVVLTLYTSQFSPRVIENFLSNKNTTRTFGIFVGGFVYSIMSLLFLKNSNAGGQVISASIGVIYIIYGLIYFSTFINSVGTYIQPSNIIDRLYSESLSKINDYKKFIENKKIIKLEQNNKYLGMFFKGINCHENGYIQMIDYNKILTIANKAKAIIIFEKVTGQFLTDKTRMFSVYYDKDSELVENIDKKLQNCVVIGDTKTEKQDFSFIIQKIEEIAIRALSPGINDPNTAIHCIRIIGISIRDLGGLEKGYIVMDEDTSEKSSVLVEAFDFKKLVYSSFNQIMHYAKEDYKVVLAIIKSLRFIIEKANPENQKIIKDYSEFIRAKINKKELNSIENKILEDELKKINSHAS